MRTRPSHLIGLIVNWERNWLGLLPTGITQKFFKTVMKSIVNWQKTSFKTLFVYWISTMLLETFLLDYPKNLHRCGMGMIYSLTVSSRRALVKNSQPFLVTTTVSETKASPKPVLINQDSKWKTMPSLRTISEPFLKLLGTPEPDQLGGKPIPTI